MNLTKIRDFSESGVFLLLDRESRSFYINHTVNFKYFLEKACELVRGSPASSGNFELLELSKSQDIETLKLHTEYWRDQYLDAGFKELGSRGRKTVQYRCRVRIDSDLTFYNVELVSARGDVVSVVGRFSKFDEAVQFQKDYYGDNNRFCFPVFATNDLTKSLLGETEKHNKLII